MMNYECINGVYMRPERRTFGYSDGDAVEDYLYARIREAADVSVGSAELAAAIRDWPTLYHLSPARVDLLRPLEELLRGATDPVSRGPLRILEIGCGCGAITRYLGELGCHVTALEGSERRARITRERCRDLENVRVVCDNFSEFAVAADDSLHSDGPGQYDVVLLIGVLEYSRQFIGGDHPPLDMLRKASAFLRPEGQLVLAIENKLGLKYWAGAPEDHTGRPFDGLENRYDQHSAVTFGKEELARLLTEAGFPTQKFLYPFPDYKLPEIIITENAFAVDALDLSNLLYEKFDYPHGDGQATEFSPTRAAAGVLSNGLMKDLANSFLIVAGSGRPVGDSTLVYMYNSARLKPYCKRNILVRTTEGLKIVRQRLYPDTPPPADAPLAHHVSDEDFLPGRLLSTFVLDIVTRPGWTLRDLYDWTAAYYRVLTDHVRTGHAYTYYADTNHADTDHDDTDHDGQDVLPGQYIDLTPFNIMIDPENHPRVFDQEWECPGDIPLYFVFFRGLVYSLDKIRCYAPPAAGTPTGIIELASALAAMFIPFDDTQLQECVRLEGIFFQAIPLRPGRVFAHGPICMLGDLGKAPGAAGPHTQQQTRAALADMQRQLEQMAREHDALKVQAQQQLTRIQQDHEAHVALLHQQIEWYRRTYQERSIPGLLVQRRLDAARAGEKYLTSFLLTSMQDKGWRPTASMIMKALSSKGLKGWLHPRTALLPLMRGTGGAGPAWRGPGGSGMLRHRSGESPFDTLQQQHENYIRAMADIKNFAHRPLISLIMPVYNTDARWLQVAVDSILHQWYDNWQLCIADDGSTNKATIQALARIAMLSDRRILITQLETNVGISGASNTALAMAAGEYIALMDHDDELTTDALYQVVKDLNLHGDADILYTDECKVDEEGRLSEPFYKPAYSPELLLNMMYIGHLTVYKAGFLLDKLGGFREAYDLSQDYDLALRAVEKTTRVRHIEQMVYHWRMTAGSSSQGEKPHARITNLAALRDAIARRGIDAEVTELPTANRVRLHIDARPVVSIIIPTDSIDNLKDTLESLYLRTSYPRFEIVVVTNSRVIGENGELRATSYEPRVASDQSLKAHSSGLEASLRYVPYDKPYNFSDKCNEGARHARGEIVIFFNDDVRPLQDDWLDNTIEYLFLPGVGGVSPKLIYEDDTIQYAGMATGVRNLTGTTFHGYPKNATAYFNFVQSVRNVSILSGACLAMRKDLFQAAGGFDSINTPSAHSDVDLSFRLMDAGYRLVYTPYATLRHIGHLSLKEYDETPAGRTKDKADIYLLKRWAARVADDAYFTESMRNYLYHDSPEPYRVRATSHELRATSEERRAASHEPRAMSEELRAASDELRATSKAPSDHAALEARSSQLAASQDVLLVSHDLSLSGAPIMLLQLCRQLIRNGYFVTVMCDSDGPVRDMFVKAGAPVIIDSLLLRQHDSLARFARNFDHVICNTVVTWPVVRQLSSLTNTIWWLHEAKVLELFANDPDFLDTLTKARSVIAPSRYALQYIRKYNTHAQRIYYGYPDIAGPVAAGTAAEKKLVISLFGSIEPRKGQDLLVRALQKIEENILSGQGFGSSEPDTPSRISFGLPASDNPSRQNSGPTATAITTSVPEAPLTNLSERLEIRLVGRIHDPVYHQQLLQAIGDTPYIKILGELDHEKCLDLMKDSDIVVCPSRDDPFPVVIVEAAVLSRPCIVSSHTGFAELIRDGENGYVFPDGDAGALAAKLAAILRNPQQLAAVAKASRRLYEDHMTLQAFEEKFLALLNDRAADPKSSIPEKQLSWQH